VRNGAGGNRPDRVALGVTTVNVRGEGTSISLFGLCEAAVDPKPPKLMLAAIFEFSSAVRLSRTGGWSSQCLGPGYQLQVQNPELRARRTLIFTVLP